MGNEKYAPHIVLIEVGGSDGRKIVEHIENSKFNSIECVLEAIREEEEVKEKISIMDLSYFMDCCNNTDDYSDEDAKINIAECWVGYVWILKL